MEVEGNAQQMQCSANAVLANVESAQKIIQY